MAARAGGTKILLCECPSEYQNKKYGRNKRVHNMCGRDGKRSRCTVCGKDKL